MIVRGGKFPCQSVSFRSGHTFPRSLLAPDSPSCQISVQRAGERDHSSRDRSGTFNPSSTGPFEAVVRIADRVARGGVARVLSLDMDRSNKDRPGFRPNGPDKSHRQGQRPWTTKPVTGQGLKGRPFDETLAPAENGRAVGPEARGVMRRPRPLAWALGTSGPLGRKSGAVDTLGGEKIERKQRRL